MGVFEAIGGDGHEEVVFGNDSESGLQTIIAVHSTALGPALGGTRFFPYRSEGAALRDVLRLSRAMTLKAAAAGLDLGGGKGVIIGDPVTLRSADLLEAYGRMVESLGGRYITAEDVGTTSEDMLKVRRATSHVAGLPESVGGSGDPSPATARGVMASMRAVAAHIWGTDDLAGLTVAVEGAGKVGGALIALLAKAGANVMVADVDEQTLDQVVTEHGVRALAREDIHAAECEIFAPCALGATLNDKTIGRLRCAAIVGSANNQLARDSLANQLDDRSITYVPDFVANAGGIINIAQEAGGYDWSEAVTNIDRIFDNVTEVLARARRDSITPHQAALATAEARITSAMAPQRGAPGPAIEGWER